MSVPLSQIFSYIPLVCCCNRSYCWICGGGGGGGGGSGGGIGVVGVASGESSKRFVGLLCSDTVITQMSLLQLIISRSER